MKIAVLGHTILVLLKCHFLTYINIHIIKPSIVSKNFRMIFIIFAIVTEQTISILELNQLIIS
jgi:hypothetical protein